MNWLTKFMTGTLTAGILLSTIIEPVLAATFKFEQRGIFNTRPAGSGVPPEIPFTPVDGIVRGEFTGEDINNNQILNLDELTNFFLEVVLDGELQFPVDLQYLNRFSYNLNSNALQFSGFVGSFISLDSTSETSGLVRFGTVSGLAFSSDAPVTITQVSEPVTVPEPATLAGLSALVILSIGSRVRRKVISPV